MGVALSGGGRRHEPPSSTSGGRRRAPRWALLSSVGVALVLATAVAAHATCGDGTVDAGEQCDEGAANGTASSCCTHTCDFRAAGEECRAAANVCDVAEDCDGVSATCPADDLQPDGTPCPDATVCNGAETCQGGVCTPGQALNCDDDNACTADSCDAVAGCQHANVTNGTPCPDGTVCNGDETCLNGMCSPGGPPNCDDGNACTQDSCDPVNGCEHVQLPNDTPCPNGDVCDGDEVCGGGACAPGTPLDCDDGNPCTIDSCHAVLGCQHAAVVDGTACPDGNVCNGHNTCTAGVCHPGTPLDCDDGNVCTTDSCDPILGCQHGNVANGTSCSDGDFCNGAETCQAGTCTASSAPNCQDGNPCTADTCDPVLGCQHATVSNGTPCLDNNVCNGAETCQAGTCTAGTPLDCDDENVCTNDSCSPTLGCQHTNADGTPCPDGTLCNGNEVCQGGACAAGTAPDCDDHNACTTDSCDASLGCVHTFTPGCQPCTVNGDCNDNDVCNGTETCQAGTCAAGTPLSCDDGNVCTSDSCDATLGCQHTNVTDGTACPDGNRCNGRNTCQAGTCEPGTPLDCNDGNPCTSDSCDPPTGCQHTNVSDGTPCLDGTVCNGSESCQAGTCTAGTALDCNDGDPCTSDSCDAVLGCQHPNAPNGTPCPDSTVCNGNETCVAGTCTPGTPPDCDDSNVCTNDSCNATLGCQHAAVANGTPCLDGTVCNGAESCQAGTCTAGTSLDCNDHEGCTADACDPVSGCSHNAIPGCQTCVADNDCNDGVPCTADTCVEHACTFTPDSDLCPNHYLCDKAKVTPTTAKFVIQRGVLLTDAFESRTFDISAVKHLCPPENEGAGIVDPLTHLTSYKVKVPALTAPETPQTLVKMTNELGTLRFNTIKVDLLLVPTAKSLTGPPDPLDPDSDDSDEYKCYKAKVTPGTPTFPKNLTLTLSDQFTSPPKLYSVKSPKHVCLPVSRNGAPIKNSSRHYVCYKVKVGAGEPFFTRRTNVHINNAIQPLTLDVIKEDEVCLPSLRNLPGCSLNIDCNDSNACTTDLCTNGDCQHINVTNGSPCPDGNFCNGAETCHSGICVPGSAPTCNDGNPCTLDSCLPASGCANLPLSNGTSCGPGLTCTGGVCG